MQTVWSRVAQTRCLCNCPACVTTTSAIVARRTTTAVARRRVRVGDVFTVFASSLAATATLHESRKKDARRKQWEKVIAETRAQVQETETQQQNRLAYLCHLIEEEEQDVNGPNQSDIGFNVRSEGLGGRKNPSETSVTASDTWVSVFQWAAQNREDRALAGFQDWRGPPLTLLQQLSTGELQQLISNRSILRAFYGGPDCDDLVDETVGYSLSAKKLRTLEWSTAKLVLQFLSQLQPSVGTKNESRKDRAPLKKNLKSAKGVAEQDLKSEGLKTASTDETVPVQRAQYVLAGSQSVEVPVDDTSSREALLRKRLDHVEERLKALRQGPQDARSQAYEDFETPVAPRYLQNPPNDSNDLNISLSILLKELHRDRNQSPTISKICQNLLAAKTPPNIHTLNMLLVRFCQMDNRNMVRNLLIFLLESHMRPNELTHSVLLRHYMAINDNIGFTKYLLLMKGYHQGLALAAPNQNIPYYVRHRYRIFGRLRLKVAVKARMNAEVYETLITGALRFYGAGSAMKYFRDMIDEGWQASIELLTSIFESCCEKLDWENGLAVWQQIRYAPANLKFLAYPYECMLQFCEMCKQDLVFDHVLQDGIDRGILPASLKSSLEGRMLEDLPPSLDFRQRRSKPKRQKRPIARATELLPVDHEESQTMPASTQTSDPQHSMLSSDEKSQDAEPDVNASTTQATASSKPTVEDLTLELSAQIQELNEELLAKMTQSQIGNFRASQRNRKNSEVIAHYSYREYREEVNSELQKQFQEGQALAEQQVANSAEEDFQKLQRQRLDCGLSKSAARAVYEGFKRDGTGLSIDDYIPKLLDEAPVKWRVVAQTPSSAIYYSLPLKDMSERPAQAAA